MEKKFSKLMLRALASIVGASEIKQRARFNIYSNEVKSGHIKQQHRKNGCESLD